MRLHRLTFAIVPAVLVAALAPATAAQAETRSGTVTVSIPSTIVIDGGDIPISATSSALSTTLDTVAVAFYTSTKFSTLVDVKPNATGSGSTDFMTPGTVTAHADFMKTPCDYSSSDPCYFDSTGSYYEFVHGLDTPDSNLAIAKYGSKLALTAVRSGETVTWTVHATHFSGFSWVDWPGASVTLGDTALTTGTNGTASWAETVDSAISRSASVAETDTVWSATSASVSAAAYVAPPTPIPTPSNSLAPVPVAAPSPAAKPTRVGASAAAATAARGLAKGIGSVRKVVKITKKNDSNHLLGKAKGYTSAAVLYDRRTSCSDGPGVDCGATIEKFTSTARAKARAKYIQSMLRRYPFLGTEHDTVHGHFLLRVSGELTSAEAAAYRSAFRALF